MKISRTFDRCIFDATTLRKAIELFGGMDGTPPAENATRTISEGRDSWAFDSDDEFFGAYAKGFTHGSYTLDFYGAGGLRIAVRNSDGHPVTTVEVTRPTRAEIDRVMNVFAEQVAAATVPEPPPSVPLPPPPVIYIGHGHSSAWRDLKDHLQDQHGYRVEAYETGARAGHAIRDILASMAERSSFAVLVMTAEDKQADGSFRARENVVHEVGLFQGTLGFDCAIVAVEDGVEPFSNLQGIEQLRFSAGNIKEIFGDVLATLRREFPATTA